MPPKKKNNNALAFSILFSALVLSASIVFFGLQMQGGSLQGDVLQAEIEKGIEAYVQKAQDDYDQQVADSQPPERVEVDFSDDDAVLGDADAQITMIEFSDYECPYCATFYRETLPKIKSEYIDSGQVKLVYRDNPLSFHDNAYPAALAAECVRDQLGDEGYFDMHDKLFGGNSLALSTLEGYATDLGVDIAEYNSCVNGEKFKEEIEKDMNDARSLKLNGTPSFIINGRIVTGAQPFEVFSQVIEEELAS